MSCSRVCTAFLVLVAMAGAAHAQTQGATEELGVDEFRRRIEEQLPELRRFEADLLMAEAQVVAAGALPDLQLSYEREETFASGAAVDRMNAVAVTWSIDISGARQHRIKSAEFSVRALRHQSEYQKQILLIGAMRVYYVAARARLRVESLHASRAPISALVDTLRNRVKEGDASGYDLARFELQLGEHDSEISDAATELAVAQAKLAGLFGASGTNVVAASELQQPQLAQASAGPVGANRGDIVATGQAEESGRSQTRAASRWWIPTLGLSVGHLRTEAQAGDGLGYDGAQGYIAMVSASIPLFTRGNAERKQGEAKMRQAQVQREILARQIQSQVQVARTRLAARLEQASLFERRQLAFVAALVQQTEAAYLGGEASALDLGESYSKASAAQLRFIELRFLCRLAELALWSATGTRTEGASP